MVFAQYNTEKLLLVVFVLMVEKEKVDEVLNLAKHRKITSCSHAISQFCTLHSIFQFDLKIVLVMPVFN